MVRLFAALAAAGTLALPSTGSASGLYSFIDGDGVIHVTNVLPRAVGTALPESPTSRSAGRPVHRTTSYDGHICVAAAKYGVAPPLLKAVMAVESNFNPAAVSQRGATGLMQLMPLTAEEMYVFDLRDPAQNIQGGARYLSILQDQFAGDLEKVLSAYNAGPERVRRSGGAIPRIAETRAYVRKVLALRDRYMRTPWCGLGQPAMWTTRDAYSVAVAP